MTDKFQWADEPGHTAFPIARPGYPIVFVCAFVTCIFALLGLSFLAVFSLTATFFVCWFFRDPDRVIPAKEGAVVSPADGKVIIAEAVEDNRYYNGPCKKVSIFMNVFNVHVNRIPYEGTITDIQYFPGKFFNADLDKASKDNEQNAIFMETKDSRKISFVQIAGLIARRIICRVQEGDKLQRGQRFGMICFGSRLDVYLPENTVLEVAVGDKVKAGTSVLGCLH